MNRLSKLVALTVTVIFLLILCSCSILTYDRTDIRGGTPLNDNLMSVIKGDILSDAVATDGTSENANNSGNDDISNDEISIDKSENSVIETVPLTEETEHNESVDTSTSSENQNADNVCYWTESGSVWHTYRDCYHIKNSKNILLGTVEEALENGKSHVCSSCAKREE